MKHGLFLDLSPILERCRIEYRHARRFAGNVLAIDD
jgi:hypothetical protein